MNNHKNTGQFNLETPIFKKTYDFLKEFYIFQLDFPKKDRYSLGQRCETYLLGVLEGIMLASQTSKDRKYLILQQASGKLDMLKVFVRLAGDIKILSDSRYIKCQNQIQEIGKMLGGWMKSVHEDQF